jgi:hypothetical protein
VRTCSCLPYIHLCMAMHLQNTLSTIVELKFAERHQLARFIRGLGVGGLGVGGLGVGDIDVDVDVIDLTNMIF